MAKFVEIDEQVTLSDQMEDDTNGTVILFNKFNVNPDEAKEFMEAWTADVKIFKEQPGFISTQLHRGIAGGNVFINQAVCGGT